MVKILTMVGVALVLFCASAAGSWFLLQSSDETPNVDEPPLVQSSTVNLSNEYSSPERSIAETTFQPSGISAETVLRLSESIKRREQSLKQREALLAKKEERLGFLLGDLKREREEINSLFESMELSTQQAQQILDSINSSSVSTQADRPDTVGPIGQAPDPTVISDQEKKNLQTMAQWLQGMPPDQAAESIKQFCNDGKIEMAVKLLSFFEERNAAKILGALQDPSLFADLAGRFRSLQRAQAQTK